MKIETHKFGTIDVPDEKVITIRKGILGFAGRNRFVLLQRKEMAPFCLLQSVEDPYLSFFVVDPYLFRPDYDFDLSEARREVEWREGDNENLAIIVIVRVPAGEPEKMTANLLGPIVLNNRNNTAVQYVLPTSDYSPQHPIFEPEKQ